MSFIHISLLNLSLTLVFVAFALLFSWRNRLRLGKDILVGAARTALQLTAAGFILKFVFNLDLWYVTLIVLTGMIIAAGFGAMGRLDLKGTRMFGVLVVSIAGCAVLGLAFLLAVVVRVEPWYNPRYVIPVAGMVVGNSMTAAALCLNRFHSELRLRRAEIEARLALGATSTQAAAGAARAAARAAAIPVLASLATVGMVSLPGMMTGQILAGVDPTQAIRYQIAIMYVLLATKMATAVLAVKLARHLFFTPAHQLRPESPAPNNR